MTLPLSSILGGGGTAGILNSLGTALSGGGAVGTGVGALAGTNQLATALGGNSVDPTAAATLTTFVSQDPYTMTKTAMASGVAGGNLDLIKGIEDMTSFARFQVAGALQDVQTAQLLKQQQAAQLGLGGAGLLGAPVTPTLGAAAVPAGGAAAQAIGAVNSALQGLGGGGSLANILAGLSQVPATAPAAASTGLQAGGAGGLLQMLMLMLVSTLASRQQGAVAAPTTSLLQPTLAQPSLLA